MGEWKELTTAEVKTLWIIAEKKPSAFAALLSAKLREKNHEKITSSFTIPDEQRPC